MSGTSVAAPIVSGAAALLLQSNPNLTPDQVKYRLMSTARPFATKQQAGAGYLNIYAAITSTTTISANTGTPVSAMLSSTGAVTANSVNWNSVNWNSVNWNSVNWNSVNWNSVNWNSVNWNSDYWGGN
jgi:serine protease AprX